ncbi:MAG: hypothetical protein CL840_05795 [Crocinitomicaceae bacterium]|nr:hypothetical protein [Crocinitomicaceae bacterium]|tara:strand:- start:10735 stop:11400 length:666 start_codon:yes stop_codon:yes gene_type:complete
MTLKTLISLLLFGLAIPIVGISQEDQNVISDENPETMSQGKSSELVQEKKDRKKSKKGKKEKTKKKDIGPALIAAHKKDKIQRYFKVGETIRYQTKTSKKKVKGTLEEIKKDKIVVDGKEVKVKDLILVGKSFGKTMGWRSAGFAKFAVGTGLATVGVLLVVLGGNQYSVDNSNVVWGTLGVVVGSGVSFVGIHLMVKGGKGVFQNSNKKQKRGWTFSVKM